MGSEMLALSVVSTRSTWWYNQDDNNDNHENDDNHHNDDQYHNVDHDADDVDELDGLDDFTYPCQRGRGASTSLAEIDTFDWKFKKIVQLQLWFHLHKIHQL